MRSFGLIFGGTTQAVAMVLAVYMGGLAVGGALAARRAVKDPLQAYARLELLTGLGALLTLPLLRALPWLYGTVVAGVGLTGVAESLGIALRRVAGHRARRGPRAAAAHDPAGRDGPARRRVPGAIGTKRSPRLRPALPAEHARRRRGHGARAVRAGAGVRRPRNAGRGRGAQPFRRERRAALGAGRPGPAADRVGGRRGGGRARSASPDTASRSRSRPAPPPSASRCSGPARTRS